jgi:hypothetical protein
VSLDVVHCLSHRCVLVLLGRVVVSAVTLNAFYPGGFFFPTHRSPFWEQEPQALDNCVANGLAKLSLSKAG